MTYTLPTEVELGGVFYDIRTHYVTILEIIEALNDPELDDFDRGEVLLTLFYPDFDRMPQSVYSEAVDYCLDFIAGGKREEKEDKGPRLVDWEKDFPLIVSPVNHILGREIRSEPYLHWWTFLAAYQEIGECTFSQVVKIRDSLARGKKLDKQDREWYRKNRHLVDFENKYTQAEDKLLEAWGMKAPNKER